MSLFKRGNEQIYAHKYIYKLYKIDVCMCIK